jgi:predicted  nucleic acid-binding Zn-ribbon protein
MIDWPLAFSTASQAIKLANDLRSIDKEVSQAELKLKVADLSTALADLKMTLTEAKSDAAEKDDEINRLKKLQQRLAEETVELYGYQIPKAQGWKGGRSRQPDV